MKIIKIVEQTTEHKPAHAHTLLLYNRLKGFVISQMDQRSILSAYRADFLQLEIAKSKKFLRLRAR